jgi:pectate lyase
MPAVSRRRFISGLFVAGAATQLPAVRAWATDPTPTPWSSGVAYATGSRVTYQGRTWRAVSATGRGQYPQGVGDGSRSDRDLLLAQRNGFAQAVTGGDAGATYVVTSTADTSTPGTLRYGLTRAVPLWIVFDKSLGPSITIQLQSKLKPLANKTVDGRGVSVRITGSYDLSIKGLGTVNNIWAYVDRVVAPVDSKFSVSHGFSIDGTPASGAPVGFDLIWLHHVGFGQTGDSIVGMGKSGTAPSRVTVDWCSFGPQPDVDAWLYAYNAHTLGFNNSAENGKGAMCGLDPQDGAAPDAIQTTFHHNRFLASVQRNIKVHRSRSHFYNNFIDRWGYPPLVTVPSDAKNHPDAQQYAQTNQAGSKVNAVNPTYGAGATEIGPDGELLCQNNVFAPYAKDEEHVLSAALVRAGYLTTPWLVTAPRLNPMRFFPVKPNAALADPLVKSSGNWSPAGALADLNLQLHPEQVFTGVTYASDASPYAAIGSGQTRAAGENWNNDAPYAYALAIADAQLRDDLAIATGNVQAWVAET